MIEQTTNALHRGARACVLLGGLGLLAACGGLKEPQSDLNPGYVSKAIHEATKLQNLGRRVWCVPFARNASGVEIRGNAHTWWRQAEGQYERTKDPKVGSVMSFSKTRKLRLGHVAVVSEIIDDRLIKIHHANWHRNRISMSMAVKDVSDKGDWSKVRVESNPGSFGRVYLVDGFILPNTPEDAES
ncbi:MAG: CHAP domain-containing protein [Pseudomonadota bacterium]